MTQATDVAAPAYNYNHFGLHDPTLDHLGGVRIVHVDG